MTRTMFKSLIGFFAVVNLVFLLIPAAPLAYAENLAAKADQTPVRSGPGENHRTLYLAGQYYPFKLIKRSGEWVNVVDFEGEKGWVHQAAVDTTETVIVRINLANIRLGPGTDYPVVFTCRRGATYKILGKEGIWINVLHKDGDMGWISRNMVWGLGR
ncbi:MAG: SH3 domain-containing protein [Deltaproteobacteria bacterium]|nr:SH3 domain-containing protein [Deltaproteobacteria bacterium]